MLRNTVKFTEISSPTEELLPREHGKPGERIEE
jgi:hypothetical protein